MLPRRFILCPPFPRLDRRYDQGIVPLLIPFVLAATSPLSNGSQDLFP